MKKIKISKKTMESQYAVAIWGGVLCSLAGTFIVGMLHKIFPTFTSPNLDAFNELMGMSPVIVAFLLFVVIIVSPIVEEFVFRKFLWWLSGLVFSPTTTLVLISLLFAYVHGDWLHIIGLLPISFFLGWMRMRTGGIRHPIVAHIANNAFASAVIML